MPMPVPGLDAAKCEVRNLKAARKGVHTIPLRLATGPPEGPSETQVNALGTLPKDEAAALRRINDILGKDGDDALRADQVYLLYPEAGNTNYIGDRYMFLGESTLKNVAGSAVSGFAFMNSHRTGDISTPSELPFGRTFAGRYEKFKDRSGSTFSRALLGVYMLRGQRPNGANGPSTDDLYRGIDGGTIFDVSLGLTRDGWCQCDVCGNDLDDYDPETYKYLCPHIPGTTRRMTDAEIADQESRGVPGGVATFTLQESSPGEISAVFDGAVPGAGFAKALAFARHGRLSDATRSSLFDAYRPFWSAGDLRFFPESARLGVPIGNSRRPATMSRLLSLFRFWEAAGKPALSLEDLHDLTVEDDDNEVPPDVPPRFRKRFRALRRQEAESPPSARVGTPAQRAAAQAAIDGLAEDLSRSAGRLAAASERRLAVVPEPPLSEAEVARRAALASKASAFAEEQVGSGLADPVERDDLATMFRLCSEVDRAAPPALRGVSLLASFRRLLARRSEDAPPSFERKLELLSLIPSGRAAIENGLLKRH